MMYLDTQNYLTNDILFKVDRASMSNSLETRAPFLDKDIFNFSSNLPLSKKIKNGKGKKILRELLKDKIPSGLVDRPKAGFSIPIGDWIKGPLIDWSEDLLSKNSVEKSGYLNFKNVEKIWKNHKNGYDNSNLIWSILVFQQWLKKIDSMKICVISPILNIAGVPLAQLRLSKALSKKGHNVDLIFEIFKINQLFQN